MPYEPKTRTPRAFGGASDGGFGAPAMAWRPLRRLLVPRWTRSSSGSRPTRVTASSSWPTARSDAFLHANALHASGHDSVPAGAKLKVLVGAGAKRRAGDAGGGSRHGRRRRAAAALVQRRSRPRRAAAATRRAGPGDGGGARGTVKWFDDTKGFGFVASDDGGKDVFVHISILGPSGISRLTEGQHVNMRVVDTPKGPRGHFDHRLTARFVRFPARPPLRGRAGETALARPRQARRNRARQRRSLGHAAFARHQPPQRDHGALRTPESGCSWDLEQTFATIVPYTLEEAYEVADAIERGDVADLREELGDLLLQVVFHARMAEEEDQFDFGDVVEAITRKLIRRHPHVFGDARDLTSDEVKALWGRIKAEEKRERAEARRAAGRPAEEATGALAGVPLALPALTRALKLQQKAGKVGFDWNDPRAVLAKLREEDRRGRGRTRRQ